MSRKETLLKDLKDIRNELFADAEKIQPEEFDWEPRPGMKSAKALLREIGSMEKICMQWLIDGSILDWERAVEWSGDDVKSTLEDLKRIRQDTVKFLEGCSDSDLVAKRPVPDVWKQYWGNEIFSEQAPQWVARHEYYHLGQLIYNRWILGHNPYKSQ